MNPNINNNPNPNTIINEFAENNFCVTITSIYKISLEKFIKSIESNIGEIDLILLSLPLNPFDPNVIRYKIIKENHHRLIINAKQMCTKIEYTRNLFEKMYLIIFEMGYFSSFSYQVK